jgi:hypothetical protein
MIIGQLIYSAVNGVNVDLLRLGITIVGAVLGCILVVPLLAARSRANHADPSADRGQ